MDIDHDAQNASLKQEACTDCSKMHYFLHLKFFFVPVYFEARYHILGDMVWSSFLQIKFDYLLFFFFSFTFVGVV